MSRKGLPTLAANGVRFVACRRSAQRLGLTPDDLLPQVRLVNSGAGELVRKQAEGWAYLRP